MDANEKELRELLEKATPGKWQPDEICAQRGYVYDDCVIPVCSVIEYAGDGSVYLQYPNHENNRDFIIAAHNHLPALFSQLDALRAENERMKERANRTIPQKTIGDVIDEQAMLVELLMDFTGATLIEKVRGVVETVPKDAAGLPLMLGTKVFVVMKIAKQFENPGYGRGIHASADIEEAEVVGIGKLGEINRRISLLQRGMSVTASVDLRAVFRSRETALAAQPQQPAKEKE